MERVKNHSRTVCPRPPRITVRRRPLPIIPSGQGQALTSDGASRVRNGSRLPRTKVERYQHHSDESAGFCSGLSSTTMGIDICARWRGQTEDEIQAQYRAGFSVEAGGIGYLREVYHGEPYATRHLCAEAFAAGEADIPSATLRDRLPETLRLAEERERRLYAADEEDIRAVKQSFSDFVSLCERKERETGFPVRIIASY